MLNQFWNIFGVILQIAVHGHNHITSGRINASLHCGRLLEIAQQANKPNMRSNIFCGRIQLRPCGITATVINHNQFPLKWIVDQCRLHSLNQITGQFFFVVHWNDN